MDNFTMKYKDAIKASMESYIKYDDFPNVIFMGYNVAKGSKAGGTLKNIPDEKLFEMPVAENLMLSSAIGMSIEGYLPVVYFERFNFVINALDAMVNHLDKFESLSRGEFKPKVIIRAVIGGTSKPFYTGSTHTQDFTEAIQKMVDFPVIKLHPKIESIMDAYYDALVHPKSVLIIEETDLYDTIIE